MADKTWKAVERQIARRLGGQRVGVTGRSTADVIGAWFVAEIKYRKTLPQWLKDALAQARAAANDQQLPIAVLHESGQRFSDAIIMLRLADFEDWFGKIEH
jgi:GAF domain-containing protein